MERKKTFLSYNRRDKTFVEQIARWLEDEAKIPVWLDKWNLIPDDPWQEDIEKALDESQCCVVFIGPDGIGPWKNEEMRSTIDSRVSAKSIRVVPVLLPGVKRPGKESRLPRFLRGLTWVEFKDKWDDPDELHRLECGIRGGMKYKAFISYSHTVDGILAPAIQKSLESIAKPWYKMKAFNIFRDETDLSTSPHLWRTIENALKESECMILMASQESAKSEWVKREIEFWLKQRSIYSIHIVLTDGDIKWDKQNNDFDWDETTSLPELLKGKYKGMPKYSDSRDLKDKKALSLDNEEFENAIMPVAAALHGKTVGELSGEMKKQHAKNMRLRNYVILVLLTLLFLLIFFGIQFYFEKRNVQIQLARNYWENARKARDEGRHLYSFHLWAEAVAVNPDPTFRKILLFDMNDYWSRLSLLHIFKHGGSVSKAKFNADGTRISYTATTEPLGYGMRKPANPSDRKWYMKKGLMAPPSMPMEHGFLLGVESFSEEAEPLGYGMLKPANPSDKKWDTKKR